MRHGRILVNQVTVKITLNDESAGIVPLAQTHRVSAIWYRIFEMAPLVQWDWLVRYVADD